MKKNRCFNYILSLLVFFCFNLSSTEALFAQSQPSAIFIAILEMDPKGGISADEASIITERFRAQLLRTGRFKIMERAKMDELLKEQGFQASAYCNTSQCAVKLGRLLGVDYIVSGSASQFGSLYSLSARMVNVENGNLVIEDFEDCECPLEALLTKSPAMLSTKFVSNPVFRNLRSKPAPQYTPLTQIKVVKNSSLTIVTEPTGAAVFLNKKAIGKSPVHVKNLAHGVYELKIVQPNFETSLSQLKIEKEFHIENIKLTQTNIKQNGWQAMGIVGGTLTLLVLGGLMISGSRQARPTEVSITW